MFLMNLHSSSKSNTNSTLIPGFSLICLSFTIGYDPTASSNTYKLAPHHLSHPEVIMYAMSVMTSYNKLMFSIILHYLTLSTLYFTPTPRQNHATSSPHHVHLTQSPPHSHISRMDGARFNIPHTHTHTRLTARCPGLPG